MSVEDWLKLAALVPPLAGCVWLSRACSHLEARYESLRAPRAELPRARVVTGKPSALKVDGPRTDEDPVRAWRPPIRASSKGKTTGFGPVDLGSIPRARSLFDSRGDTNED